LNSWPLVGSIHKPTYGEPEVFWWWIVSKKEWQVMYDLSSFSSGQQARASMTLFLCMHYSLVDNATLKVRQSSLLAKVDLKSAFGMVLVYRDDWELLGN